jgi:hypothetical protein
MKTVMFNAQNSIFICILNQKMLFSFVKKAGFFTAGLAGQQHDELSGGVFGGNQQVHFPEQVDQHHLPHPHVPHVPHIPHVHHDIAPEEHRNKNLKRVLLPLAGIALLGAAAALATNPVLLQLGVVSGK